MNKTSASILAVLAAVLLVAGLWWSRHRSAPAPAAAAPVVAVTTAGVQQRDVPVTLEATGTVVSLNTVDIHPQVASTVRRVAIREGQTVRQGDLLFTFDDRADRANLEKARAQVAHDRAALADLQRQLDRARELRAQNFVAQSAVDSALAQVQAQQALLQSDQAAVHASEVNLGYNEIRSPLAGRAGAIDVHPGSYAQPAGNALVTISQLDPIGVSFAVPESELDALLHGAGAGADAASAEAAAIHVQPGGNGAAQQGRVDFVDNAVDPATGTIRVKGRLANPARQLWPGQFVTVELTTRILRNALVVPQAALILRDTQRSVYVVGADGKAQSRPVTLRYAAGDMAVVEGLAPGERVVVDGKQNLRPGTPVRATAGDAAQGAAS
jgi:RND family efflux transporter MFP subunit